MVNLVLATQLLFDLGIMEPHLARVREKQLIRQGVSTTYAAIDTVLASVNQNLFYQYYIKNAGADVREYYYNYFYGGDIPEQAIRREVIIPNLALAIRDTFNSIVVSKRQPVFPNLRMLNRGVRLRWEVDLRPAYRQILHGRDTLFDFAGDIHIANADSIIRMGVWINGPATGGWQTWGATLRADTSRKMFDDGTNGDIVAGDSIYTRLILVAPESIGVGSKGQIAQYARFSIGGGDNEVGKRWVGANHFENINDTTNTYAVSRAWGVINPRFYSRWDYDHRGAIIDEVHDPLTPPSEFLLAQNYPNPFNPTTQITYALPRESFVSLKVYNVLGEEVATLVEEKQSAATHRVSFDASRLSSGVYFYRLTAGQFTSVKKMIFIQ